MKSWQEIEQEEILTVVPSYNDAGEQLESFDTVWRRALDRARVRFFALYPDHTLRRAEKRGSLRLEAVSKRQLRQPLTVSIKPESKEDVKVDISEDPDNPEFQTHENTIKSEDDGWVMVSPKITLPYRPFTNGSRCT